MFSWICPQCGRDVPPSKTDCPYCAEAAAEAAAAAAAYPTAAPVAVGAPPSQPPYQQPPGGWQPPPPQNYAPQQPTYAPPPQQTYAPPPPPPPQYAPPPPPPQQYAPQYPPPPPHHQAAWQPPEATKSGIPPWLVTVAATVGFLALGAAFYLGVQHFGRSNPTEKAGVENPANPSRQKVSNPLQKYVEVVGLRMITEDKRPVAKFVVVNHSGSEIADLAANVTLWASTSRSEEDSVGTFSFKLASLGPNESKELTEPLKTKLKMYELPDWQNATAEIEITSPSAN